MEYSTTITKKGQITIPRELRKVLNLRELSKVILELEKGKKEIKLKPGFDILDLAGKFRPKKIKPLLKARKELEKSYRRF